MTDRTTARPAMRCAETEEALAAYVRDELDAAAESRLARHLTQCASCAATAALAERVEVELAALPAFDAPPVLIDRIKAAARADRERPATFPRQPGAGRAATRRLAAAAVLAAGLAVGWWQFDRPPRPSRAEVAAAEREARYALALVARLGRRATEEVRDEVLVERVAAPVLRTMNRQFGGRDEDTPGGRKL